MKILHICNLSNSPFSGISVVVPQHIQAQARICDVYVWNLNGKKIDSDAKQISEKYFYSGSLDIDIVVFHGVYFYKYAKIGKFLKKHGVPYIVFPHGSLTKVSLAQKRLKKLIANFFLFSTFLKNASAIQFLSDNEKETSLFASKGFVCGNGVAIPSQKKNWNEGQNVGRFVYIGRFDVFHKGIDLLLDAVELEKEFLKSKGFVLNLYGPNQKDVKKKKEDAHTIINQMIKQRRIDSLVYVNDAVYGSEKTEILLKNDVFIQTSRFEGLPLGILEALSLGLPCLVTKGTNLDELVNNYNAGWGVETTSKMVASAIKNAVLKEHSLIEKTKSALQLIEENFTWNKIAKRSVDFYLKLIASRIK